MEFCQFVDSLVEKIKPLETAARLAWWNLAVSGQQHFSDELQIHSIQLRQIYASEESYKELLSYGVQEDPLLERQRHLLLHSFIENQIPLVMLEEMVKLETEIETIYTNFRPIVENRQISNNELKDILVTSIDSQKRQKVWEASKEIGKQVECRVVELIKRRNQSAQLAGFDNYYSMRLKLQEIDEEALFELLEKLDADIQPVWNQYKTKLDRLICQKMSIEASEIMPWHYQDPFFQEAPSQDQQLDNFYEGKDLVEISQKFYEQLGLPIDDVLKRSDLFEREGKNQHAFCTCIDHEQDVRILCNLQENEYWMGVQLHELGHAIYDKYIDQSLPYLLKEPAHICMTESIAMFFGRLSKNPNFIHKYCEIPDPLDLNKTRQTQEQMANNLLVFSRWTLVMIYFERAMYQSPDEDLNLLWWDYVEKFQNVQRPSQRNAPDWASKLHLACAPVYYQNYILGEIIASQLKNTSHKLNASYHLPSDAVGAWMQESIFKYGKSFSWEEVTKKATNEALNPRYFVKDLAHNKSSI